MGFSKALDTINYDFLIVKLHAYGFGKKALDLVYSYLKNRKRRVKIKTNFSICIDLINGALEGSVLGSLLFNIYSNDLFFFLQDISICNFADDATPFLCDETLENALDKLEGNSELVIFWFENNYMKLDTNKCHLLVSGTKYEHSWEKIGGCKIWKSNEVNFSGLTIDNKLKLAAILQIFASKQIKNKAY